MRKIAAYISVILILTGCQLQTNTKDEGPTRWFGPSANGVYPDTHLLKEWPIEGPEVLWAFDSLGEGFSSAVVYHGSVFTTGMIDSTGYLFHLDSEGHLVYKVPYGLEWTGSYRGTRGSPTIAGDKVYVVSGRGKLLCFNKADGAILWSKEFFSDFDGKNILWGINETPVVDGDLIYATPGGKENNVLALNRHSGEIEWSCRGEGEVSAYCTPLLVYHNGRKMLITYSASHLMGIEPLSGELLWSLDVPREYSVHLCTPLYDQGELYYPTGREKGGGKIRLSEDGESVSELWENQVWIRFYHGQFSFVGIDI